MDAKLGVTPRCLDENILYIVQNSCTYCHPKDFWLASSIPEVLTESSTWMPVSYTAKNLKRISRAP